MLLTIYFCLIVIVICTAPTSNNNQSDQDEVVVHNIELCNNDTYWTPDKLASVKQYPNPRVRRSPRSSQKSNERAYVPNNNNDDNNYWSSDKIALVKPAPMHKYHSNITKKLGIRKSPPRLLATATVEQADVKKEPFSSMGKLLFVNAGGDHYECSAQYVDTQIVLTAGHCVYSAEAKGWNKHFKFIQQYKGDENRGTFVGTPRKVLKALVSKRWYSGGSENFAYDFALLTMGEPSIADHLTMAYPDEFESLTAAGYPSNYRGGILQKFVGKKGSMASDVVEIPYDPMGPGCSGGAWIAEKESKYYVVGVNSFSIEGRDSMFSPRFTDARVSQLVQRAKTELIKGTSRG